MQDTLGSWLQHPMVLRTLAMLAGIVLVSVVIRLGQRALARYVRDPDLRYRLRKSLTFLGYLLAVLVIAVVFSDRLGGLMVALGLAGAGIAFALQEVIASIAGWFTISLGGYYKPGDRVRLGGIKGDVIDIGLLRTTLMEMGEWVNGDLYNGRVVRVANSFIFKDPVFNYSGEFPFLWDEVTIPIRHGCDPEAARSMLLRVADELVGEYASQAAQSWRQLVQRYLIEDARVEPMVTMAVNDGWLEFTLRYAVDYKQRRFTKDRLFTRILEEIRDSRGQIVLASATYNVGEVPPLSIHLRQDEPGTAPRGSA